MSGRMVPHETPPMIVHEHGRILYANEPGL